MNDEVDQDSPGEQAAADNAVSDQADSPERSTEAFDELAEPDERADAGIDLQSIREIPVTVSTELGRTSLPISRLLDLGQGSVISLDRPAGEPLDVLVNGCLIAHGEVVVVDDRFGIRLTDVLSPAERVRRLG